MTGLENETRASVDAPSAEPEEKRPAITTRIPLFIPPSDS